MEHNLSRLLKVPNRSFFLFGPRGVGKSTWLKAKLPDAVQIDLLRSNLHLKLSTHPEYLEALIGDLPRGGWVWLDEVQKIPLLLDEVHRLIEEKGYRFALSGSSARKLRRGGANLLAGRAITLHMEPFSFAELGGKFKLEPALSLGLFPLVANDLENAKETLTGFVHTYIKEEIKEEGIVRKVEPFLRFLEIAGALNGQQVNGSNMAREAHIPRSSVDSYFSILEDTLLGHFLPAYTPRVKVREKNLPKFYWVDPGLARAAAGLLYDPMDSIWAGFALETIIFHELRVYNHTQKRNRHLAYYQTPAGSEIDFIIEVRKKTQKTPPQVVCIEVKSGRKWDRRWEKPIRSLKERPGIHVKGMYGVYTGNEKLIFDGYHVMPVKEFLSDLHAGKVF